MSLLVLAFMIVSLFKIYFVLCVLVFCLHVHLCMLLWFGCDFSRRSSVGPLRSRSRGGGKFLGHCRRALRREKVVGAHGSSWEPPVNLHGNCNKNTSVVTPQLHWLLVLLCDLHFCTCFHHGDFICTKSLPRQADARNNALGLQNPEMHTFLYFISLS